MVFPGHLRCFPQGEKIELEGGYFGKNCQSVFVCVWGGGGGYFGEKKSRNKHIDNHDFLPHCNYGMSDNKCICFYKYLKQYYRCEVSTYN